MKAKKSFFIHFVSDATGTTLQSLARACLVQFENIKPREKCWNLIRTERQVKTVLEGIRKEPGPVLTTLVAPSLKNQIQKGCEELKVPFISVLDPMMNGLSSYLGMKGQNLPGLQYQINDAYFDRMEAIDFTMRQDDGKNLEGLKDADIVLVGVSRTSKTPTSIYLANRGIRAGNIPLVPGVEVSGKYLTFRKPLYVGLTESPERLQERRKSRLLTQDNEKQFDKNLYLSEDAISEEVCNARKLFAKHKWPVIDVTRRSVEETAAEIMMLARRQKEA